MTDLSDWQSTNLRCLLPIPDLALKRQMTGSYWKRRGPNGTAHANSRVEVRLLIESAKLLG
jgi:hypothetical protein